MSGYYRFVSPIVSKETETITDGLNQIPISDTVEEFKHRIEKYKEELLCAWFAKYGVDPDGAELVQEKDERGNISWYVRSKLGKGKPTFKIPTEEECFEHLEELWNTRLTSEECAVVDEVLQLIRIRNL